MKQVLFRIPGLGLPVYGFGLLAALAFAAGLALARRRSRREGIDPDVVDGMAIPVLLGGLVGSRLLYVAEYWGEKVATPAEAARFWDGGMVFYGGLIGAGAAVAVYRLVRRFPLLATLDALAPALALGVAVGRVGCFLNGCCYGDPCPYPGLAVRFPGGSPVWWAHRARGLILSDSPYTLPIHPTQLYAAVSGLLLFALVSAYYPLRRRDGEVMGLWLMAYPVTRYLVDILRDDESAVLLGMTVSQVFGVLLVGSGLLYWLALPDRRLRPPAPPAGAGPHATAAGSSLR